jgi:hypothetical protein
MMLRGVHVCHSATVAGSCDAMHASVTTDIHVTQVSQDQFLMSETFFEFDLMMTLLVVVHNNKVCSTLLCLQPLVEHKIATNTDEKKRGDFNCFTAIK